MAVGVIVTWLGGIPLSQLGGATLPGANWLAIAVVLGARTVHRSPEQPADPSIV